jgi:hypothetical protein
MNHDPLIEQYLAGPDLLKRAVAGMTKDQSFSPGRSPASGLPRKSCATWRTTSRFTPTA